MPLRSHYQQQEQIDWQSVFIRDNFLVIGYFAWIGFQQMGAGALQCNIQLPLPRAELRLHNWNFTTKFLASQCLAEHLQTLNIPSVRSLVTASEEYCPQREIMLIMQAGELIEIILIKNQVISPPAAYQLVLDRWDEFMVGDLPFFILEYQQKPLLQIPSDNQMNFVGELQLITPKAKFQYHQPFKDWLEILIWLMQWKPTSIR